MHLPRFSFTRALLRRPFVLSKGGDHSFDERGSPSRDPASLSLPRTSATTVLMRRDFERSMSRELRRLVEVPRPTRNETEEYARRTFDPSCAGSSTRPYSGRCTVTTRNFRQSVTALWTCKKNEDVYQPRAFARSG
ncbi:hypothetical protein OF83DRAFT_135538 [Amylostereum chailletii]|nr:hypothetical protein OF83DRAFT_135538 [Amylostereum chailletii]